MHGPLPESSLREWMQRLGPSLLALSHGICRDRHRAEEIVQEAFVRLWRTPPDAGEVAFGAWMRRVVTNLSINCLKRTRRPSDLPEYSGDPAMVHRGPTPPDQVAIDDRRALLEAALERLDEPKRAILMLRGAEQLGYEAIAQALDVPIGTVMSRLNRARAALMEQMDRLESANPAANAKPGAQPETKRDVESSGRTDERDDRDVVRPEGETYPIRRYRSA